MNKVNFNSLKNIKAPQAWMDKAAAIPETAPKRRAAFPVYRAAAAACLALVSAIGLLSFLLFGGQAPVVLRDRQDVSETAPAQTSGSSDTSDDEEYPDMGSVFPKLPQITPTDAQEGVIKEEATHPASSKGKNKPSATESDRKAIPSQDTDDSTQAVVSPTQGVSSPTQEPYPTSSPQPTDPPETQEPTGGYIPPGDCEIYGSFKVSVGSAGGYNITEDLTIFCRLYDSGGKLIGDYDLFSPQREATVLSQFSDGSIFAYYNPAEKGLMITEGVYDYEFYDIHNNVLYRDVKFVF